MKTMRKFLLIILVVLITTGCNFGTNNESNLNEVSDEKISLNIHQADLIASITDNEKYLNKDYLYDLETLDDNDKISVIITVKSEGLADLYNENNRGYLSLSDYSESTYAITKMNKMAEEQKKYAQDLIEQNYINEVNHSYTTLFNGFSAETTYGQFKKMTSAGLDVKVNISEVYAQPEYQLANASQSTSSYNAVTNYVNVYETGIFDSSDVDYDGENTSVAILDSGFDIHHTVFQNMPGNPMITIEEVEEMLYSSKAYSYHENIKSQDVYVNAKIPFAYDYADKDPDVAPYDSDHGTHVAGIIGGDDDTITGVAVNTQLVLMKVFGDVNQGAIQEDILAALEDAILLGVDAINLSLGTACGFSRSDDEKYINEVYEKIEAAGISVVVAASNDYSSGYGGEYSNSNKASNPDSATVGSPGTYSTTLSVASISGVKSKYIVDKDGYTFFYNEANNSAGEAYDFYEMIFDALGTNRSTVQVEYVTVPGVGKKVNYTNIDVEGKIALVKRGDTSFEEKAQVAFSEGAIGCIIYNNVAGEVFMSAGNDLKLALASVSKDDGEYLASKGSGVLVLDKSYLAGPFMSEFSSWGPVSDLSLKPEITAHGGSILSSVPGGGYDEISGTSMASPNLCGVIILVRQALKERYPDITATEINAMANQLLMSTSTIVLDEQGNPYSPRKQGSGLGNLQYALDTKAYLSVEGSAKTKLELKDDPEETGVYELVFEINNISNEELKYSLGNLTMTESLSVTDPEYVAEKAYMLDPKTSAVVTGGGSIEGDVITVNANGTATVKYTLELTLEQKQYLRKSFINGMYVEGFAVLDSMNEDNIDLSIPFLAFFGDWTAAPMFDKTFYEVESEAYNGSIDEEDKLKADYYASTPLGTYYYSYIIPLGAFVYEIDEYAYDKIPATEEHAAIGYNIETINGITTVYAGLLRNAKKMTTVIRNSNTGEIVYEHVKYDEHKAYFSGSIIPGYDLINVTARDLGLQNNTKYTFSMKAELDYGDGGASANLNNTFEFSFYVDYEAPTITDVEFYTKYDKSLKDYRYYCDVYVYDNHYAQSIRPFTIINGELTSLSEYVIPIYNDERGGISKVTLEITDYMDLLQYGILEDGTFSISNGLGFLVDDYALNQSYSFVTLPGTNSSSISYKEDYYSRYANGTYQYYKDITPGEIIDLSTMLTSDDPTLDENPEVQAKYFASLDWKSSDENVINVKNGVIEAVGAGTALITCTTMGSDGYAYSINLKIRVRDREAIDTTNKLTDVNFTYFETLKAFIDGPEISEIGETGQTFFFTEKSSISFYPSEQVKLYYELEPWNLKDYKLIWSSTNEKVATVDENGVVTALKEGSATITLKVEVDGKLSTLMASVRVNVKNEFIVEANTLVAYKGAGGDVVIPDDEGILYIGAFAFSLYTTDYEIEINDDNYDAAKTPSSNNTVTSVIIPADIQEVRKFAFYNCTALEKVTFLKNEEGDSCPFIKEYAFAGNKKLKDINLDDVMLLGDYCFEGCESLETANITNVYAMGSRAFKDCTNLKYVDITALRNAGKEVFLNCTNLTTIDNGEFTNFSEGMFKNSGLTELTFEADRIPNYCFENCAVLETVTIVNDIVYVGKKAFENCSSLKSVEFSDGASAEFIYEYAFDDCSALESITLPDSLFEFEQFVFNGCTSLLDVRFNKNTKINKNLGSIFNSCTALTTFNVDEENPYYQVDDNLLLSKDGETIVLAAPNYDYSNYTIPSNIKVIGEGAFSSITNLQAVTIENNVERVLASAFENCKNLVTVNLPETSSLVIEEEAFSGCNKLSVVNNISYIKNFAKYVFADTALTSLTLANVAINEGAFNNIDTLVSINITSNEKIGDYAFADCDLLATVIVNTQQIGKYAFDGCVSLNELTLQNVTSIEEGAFKGCALIGELNIPTLKYIGNYAFADCVALATINLPALVEIGEYAFSTTTNASGNLLTEVEFSDSLVKISKGAFYLSTNLATVKVGSGLHEIGDKAFSNCTALTSFVTIGEVNVISEEVFSEDTLLVTITIPGVEYIKGGAFLNCISLQEISLENVKEIGMQAFNNCLSLTSINIPNTTILEAGAFMGCTNVTTINMPVIESIGAQALSVLGVEVIKLPSTLTYIAPTAFYYNVDQTAFANLSGETTCVVNDYIIIDEGVLYTVTANDKYLLSAYPTAKAEKSYEVLFGTVRIEEYAGAFNYSIETIVFPDTLKLLGNMCFYQCVRLNTVEFKSTVAPTLEGTISSLDLEYDSNSEVYQYLNKYFQFNGYYPLFYGQFKDMIGRATKMNLIIPANSDVKGYDNILYKLYFKEEVKVSEYEALNYNSIDYLDKVSLVSTDVKLSDEYIIKDARSAYNLVNQDLTAYGYDQEYLDSLYNNLVVAEELWYELKMEKINKSYGYLIEEIEALGSSYDFNKLESYYSINKTLENINRDDKKYIDVTNIDSFKKGFDEYFKDLNEDINVVNDIATLPTTSVNKVGLAVVAGVTGGISLLTILGFVLKRKFF